MSGTTFNGLAIVGAGQTGGLGPGEIKFRYNTYAPPASRRLTFNTIVKVLPIATDQRVVIVPAFVRFDDDGFVVRLSQGSGAPLDQRILDATSVMVEVSEYGRLVSIP